MGFTQRQYDFCRSVIPERRQKRVLEGRGYYPVDPTSGQSFELFDAVRQRGRRIVDVQISTDGSRLFVRLEDDRSTGMGGEG